MSMKKEEKEEKEKKGRKANSIDCYFMKIILFKID